jgi:hypothetical protein
MRRDPGRRLRNIRFRPVGERGPPWPPSAHPHELVDAAVLHQAGVDVTAGVDADPMDVAARHAGQHVAFSVAHRDMGRVAGILLLGDVEIAVPAARDVVRAAHPGPLAKIVFFGRKNLQSNEIVALPLLPERLALIGALVTIDAIGTQSAIAEKILERSGDHLLALKANRPATVTDVAQFFAAPPAGSVASVATTDGEHGRIEVRRHRVCHDIDWLSSDRRYPDEVAFPGLAMIAMVAVETERQPAPAQADRQDGRREAKPVADAGLSAAEREELSRLRRENKQLRLERDIRSRATAWFARETGVIPSGSSGS